MIPSYILHNIKTIYTPPLSTQPRKGKAMDEILEIHDAYIVVSHDHIEAVGSGDYTKYLRSDMALIDAKGAIVTPGFIDSHTHVVHGGSRELEFVQKLSGLSYLDILKQGGGILRTVQATIDASEELLYLEAKERVMRFFDFGVTTLEAKSGYGLDPETEEKQLRVQARLHHDLPIDIVSTYMGAHAFPLGIDRNIQIQTLKNHLKTIKEQKLAEFVDVFCEEGVFTLAESKTLLEAADVLGFKLKLHADELSSNGGASLAVKMKAVSADHLLAVDEAGIKALASSDVIATMLPGTSLYLNKTPAPARQLIDANIALAIGSDYNPGTCPSEHFPLMCSLAAIMLGMTPNEVLTAATINGAFAVNRGKDRGVIASSMKADFVLFNAPNFAYVLTRFGINHATAICKNGHLFWRG